MDANKSKSSKRHLLKNVTGSVTFSQECALQWRFSVIIYVILEMITKSFRDMMLPCVPKAKLDWSKGNTEVFEQNRQ